jgi:peptide/nickel transport system permease protein
VVLFFLLMMAASFFGIIAKDWSREKGVSYANPAFLAGAENLEARAMAQKEAAKVPPVDLSDIDPLAPRYKEWEERAAKIAVTEVKRAETLPMGGDKWGRDVLQKVDQGVRGLDLRGHHGALFATALGTMLGAGAGYWGGWVNDLLEWFYNVFTSIPYILLILAFAAVAAATGKFGKGILPIVLILGLTGWTGPYRLIRAEYIKHSNREYVKAAQAIGASNFSRMFVHILPNVSHVSLVQLSQHTVQFIKAEVILSFLGFGVPVDMVSWGTMLAEAQNELVIGKWWQLFAAGAAMAVLVTAFSLLTDSCATRWIRNSSERAEHG